MEQSLGLEGKAVVLLSGGLDSTTALALAISRHGRDKVIAVSFSYGQKHVIELDWAAMIAAEYQVHHERISLPITPFQGQGSSLIDTDTQVRDVTYQEMIRERGISETYVPYRNGTLLSFATALALSNQCDYVYYGAHAEDSRHWAYPDCTPEFNGALAAAIWVGSNHRVRLVTPFQWMSKGEVVRKGAELEVPFELTYSCYKGQDGHCGKCPTCVERKAAFEWAGVQDPTIYEG